MHREQTIGIQESAVNLRDLVMLAAGVAIILFMAALVFTSDRESGPAGVIGYRNGAHERWVNAAGQPVRPPPGWPPAAAAYVAGGIPDLGEGQFPAPDGRAVAFLSTTADRYSAVSLLMVKEGVRVTPVAQLGGDGSPQLIAGDKAGARSADGVPLLVSWSPDGRYLAWGSVNEPPYNLHIADRATLTARSLRLEGGYAGELAWSPDGRYLAISTYAENRTDHTLLVLDTLGHDAPLVLAKGCVMVWSPDSRHLVLHGEPKSQPGLLLVSVEGRVSQIVDQSGVAPFAWLPD
jgi:hypothetical protein